MAIGTPLPAELREPPSPSLRVLARDGQLLREVRTDDGARSRPLPLAQFPKHTRDAVLAAEDRHFHYHPGFDPIAITRAAFSNVAHRRVVSGASTITMQLARTLRPHKRSLWGKLTETSLALRIEASLSKDQILEAYLNRVTYGPNVRGYAAASQAYFGVPPESLSLAEAALIAGLPRGPSLYDVTKRPDLAKRRRDRVLARMHDAAMIDEASREQATAEPIVVAKIDKPLFGAPHLVRGLVLGTKELTSAQPLLDEALTVDRKGLAELETTLDRELQRTSENAVTATLATLAAQGKHLTAAAVVVIDNASGDVLAYVGSADFFDSAALGQNDGVLALRQPGSSLKPFIYAEAMHHLGYTGATLLPDVEIHIPLPGGGDYVPHDYDAKLRGPVRLREALANSLNVPAVHTIHELGTQRALDRLHAMGFHSLTQDAEHYGPALALGDGEVTLLELANAYATLARDGVSKPVRFVSRLIHGTGADRQVTDFASREIATSSRVLEPRVARMLTDILSDKSARMAAFGDQNVLELEGLDVAAKTGTSKGYRDNIAVGYTRDVTVAVWAGNFDGSSMGEVSGVTGAGPIFHSVMEVAARSRAYVRPPPSALGEAPAGRLGLTSESAREVGLARTSICALSGEIAGAACPHRVQEWLPEGEADHGAPCSVHQRVTIDRRNGLRAGPQCTSEVTETRVFERWRAPFTSWAQQTNRPLVPETSSPECPLSEDIALADPTNEGGSGLRITYPMDGARFVIDPERPIALQSLEIRVEPDDGHTEVRVDGELLPKSRLWTLSAGSHTILATNGKASSAPVKLTVR